MQVDKLHALPEMMSLWVSSVDAQLHRFAGHPDMLRAVSTLATLCVCAESLLFQAHKFAIVSTLSMLVRATVADQPCHGGLAGPTHANAFCLSYS